MADETTTTTQQTTTTTAEPGEAGTQPPKGAKSFTQEEVNRLVGNARAEGRKSGESNPDDGADKVSKKELLARIERNERRSAFERKAYKAGVPEEALDDLFDLYELKKPDDAGTWIAAKEGKMWTKPAAATTATQAAPETRAAPAVAPGAPPNKVDTTPTVNGVTDIFNLSPLQLEQLGPKGVREEFEKLLARANAQAGSPPRPHLPGRK